MSQAYIFFSKHNTRKIYKNMYNTQGESVEGITKKVSSTSSIRMLNQSTSTAVPGSSCSFHLKVGASIGQYKHSVLTRCQCMHSPRGSEF